MSLDKMNMLLLYLQLNKIIQYMLHIFHLLIYNLLYMMNKFH